jgi:predicted P-loop ATPase
MTFAVSLGQGLDKPFAQPVSIPPPPVEGIAAMLSRLPRAHERWWSAHTWEKNHRRKDGWRSAIAAVIDIDCGVYVKEWNTKKNREEVVLKKRPPTADEIGYISGLVGTGEMPGNLFHYSPNGFRVVFVYEMTCTSREMQVSASKGAAALIEATLARHGLFDFHADDASWDLARLYYTPNASVAGVDRDAPLETMRTRPYEIDALCSEEPPPSDDEEEEKPVAPPARAARVYHMDETIKQVVERWNAEHRTSWPERPSACPVCSHNDCFHAIPDEPSKWFCFSTNHDEDVGRPVKDGSGYWGDALDIEAHRRKKPTIDVLRDDGYLSPPKRSRVAARKVAANDATPPDVDDVAPIPLRQPQTDERFRSHSYLTAVKVLRQNAGDVLEQRKLELNEMTGMVELARSPLRDRDVSRVRSLIEERLSGGFDKKREEEIPLVISREDLLNAADQVAAENGYHPVQEYLRAQEWDGVERLNAFAKDVLGAEDTPLNRALIRRWFISAIARAMRPGCKVDNVLILCGKQGVGKSTVFKRLAGEPWFSDSPVEVQDPHAALKLRQSWVVEWAELESLQRARDAEAVKAFLTSSTDVYLAKYEKLPQRMPRSCVIVGTTNQDEFLADPTGNRRFWPIRCGERVDFDLVEKIRDQLWAEALAAFNAGETWLLSSSEATLLAHEHDRHRIRDAWEELILPWAEGRTAPFLTSEVLEEALRKPVGQWGKADEMRVSRILKQAGWVKDWRDGETASRKWQRK